MVPSLAPLGFTSRVLDNPSGPPFLVAERKEDDAAVTVLIYGHGDTVRGLDDLWRGGLSPWVLTVEGTRLYSRGTADNKGQHSVNIAALAAVIAERGRLGFNAKILIEMGEEVGSAGLRELCAEHKHKLLQADLLIASDGPRIAPDRPTCFWGRAAAIRSISSSICARAPIIPATGAACSPIQVSSLRMRSLASPMHAARSRCWNGARRCRRRCGACLRTSRSTAAGTVRRSTAIGQNRTSRRPSASSPGTASRCWPSPPAPRIVRSMPFRAMPAPIASCVTWWGRTWTTSFRRCAATSTATASRKSRCAAASAAFSAPAGSIRRTRGRFRRPFDRAHDRARARHSSQFRRIAAQRRLCRRARLAHDLDPALLCRMLPARAGRTSACADRARRARRDGGIVLGSWRARPSADGGLESAVRRGRFSQRSRDGQPSQRTYGHPHQAYRRVDAGVRSPS